MLTVLVLVDLQETINQVYGAYVYCLHLLNCISHVCTAILFLTLLNYAEYNHKRNISWKNTLKTTKIAMKIKKNKK